MHLYRISLLVFSFLGAALCQRANDDSLGYKLVPDWPTDARTAAGTPAGPWNLIQVPGVAVDTRGHVLVLHRGAHPILEFESGGKFVRSWGDGERVFKIVSFYLLQYESGEIDDIAQEMRVEVGRAVWVRLDDAPKLLAYGGEKQVARQALNYVKAMNTCDASAG